MMSQTEKLLSNIHEYQNLLGFLKDKHPTVLDEWKNNGLRPITTSDTTRTTTPEQTRNDSRQFIR
jgi:hypothetical protein